MVTNSQTTRTTVRTRMILRKATFLILAIILGLALIEGLVSLGMFTFDLVVNSAPRVAEHRHTRHDPLLGWENIPGSVVRNMYGAGRTLSINQQGFRATREYSVEVPAGKTRIVCSGDSYTLGYGVADDETFCAELEEANPAFEVVNMGQGGYGFDQAYLWYRRDGDKIQHNVHLFCLVRDSFVRMLYDGFHGYGKPMLRLEGDHLTTLGTAVPQRPFYSPWLIVNAELLKSCRLVQFGIRAADVTWDDPMQAKQQMDDCIETVAFALVQLHRQQQARQSRLVVAWLPASEDDLGPEDLRHGLMSYLNDQGVMTIDLIEAFSRVPRGQRQSKFIQPGEIDYPGAEDHYTPEGNRYIAEQLDQHLRRLLVQ